MQKQESCFIWNNHASDIVSLLGSFQQREMFVDVTLLCQGQKIKAHKIILSACSPYFQNIFMEDLGRHPNIPILGIKFEDLTAILNFMYKGEINVPLGGLASFLRAAESLEVKGLTEMYNKNIASCNSEGVQKSELNCPIGNTLMDRKKSSDVQKLSIENNSDVQKLSIENNSDGPSVIWTTTVSRVRQIVYPLSSDSTLTMREDYKYDVEPKPDTTDSSIKMQIFVESLYTSKIISLEVEPSDVIRNVMQKIPKAMFDNQEGFHPDDHHLFFTNKILSDSQTLSDCKIENGSKLLLVWPLPDNMWINVIIPDGKTIDLQVSSSCTIEDVKAKLQDKLGFPSHHQCLIFAGKILEDEGTLLECSIPQINSQGRSGILLELKLRGSILISVKNSAEKILTLEVELTDTIKSLKNEVQDKEGIPSCQQELYFSDKKLEDEHTVSDCNIKKESTLLLEKKIEIFIEHFTGQIYTFLIQQNDTVENLKYKIEEKIGIQVRKQRLIWSGKMLNDDRTIKYYNIQEKSTLHLRLRIW